MSSKFIKILNFLFPEQPKLNEVEKYYLDRNNKIIKSKLYQNCYFYKGYGRVFIRENTTVFVNCDSNELIPKSLLFNTFNECRSYHINELKKTIQTLKVKNENIKQEIQSLKILINLNR
jgi:hypothetical protein